MSQGSHILCWAVAFMVAAAPLPFGSVGSLAEASIQVSLLVAALAWIAMRRGASLPLLPWKDPLLLAGAALLAYGLLQIAPLPAGLVEILSPAGAAVKQTYSPEIPSWTALSLYPYATWRSCLNITCWILAALIVRYNALDLKGRLLVAGGAVAGGLFQASYGLYEFISGRLHIFGYEKKVFTDVATGTFISRNNFAAFLEMTIPLALALAVVSLDRSRFSAPGAGAPIRRRLAAMTGRGTFRALLLLMGAFVMVTALLMSRSRAGIMSTGFALLIGGALLGIRGRFRRFAICSIVLAATVAVFASQIDIVPLVQRFQALSDELTSDYGRLQVWTEALPMLAAYPVFGTGLGTWEMAFSPYRKDATQMRVDFAHNDYLEFGAEAGLLGFLILLAGAGIVLLGRARARAGSDEIGLAAGLGLLAMAFHSLTDFHLSIPADALMAAALAGLFLREGGPATEPRARAGRAPRFVPAMLGPIACFLLLAGLGLAAVSPAAAQMRSEPRPEEYVHDVDAGDPLVAREEPYADLCPACRLDPLNANRYIDAARSARRRLLRDVEVLLRAQAEGGLPDIRSRQYLAQRIDDAIALIERGLSLAPASGWGHLEAGMLHFGRFALIGLPPRASEDFDRARDEFAKALALQPWRGASHRKVARMTIPFWDECNEDQRQFIARATRRALEIDPWAGDIREASERMGI